MKEKFSIYKVQIIHRETYRVHAISEDEARERALALRTLEGVGYGPDSDERLSVEVKKLYKRRKR